MWQTFTLDGQRSEPAGEAEGATRRPPKPLFSRRTRTSTVITWAVALVPWVALVLGLLESL
jgi:hypothetical protein